jgi:hypothetical protein
MDLSRLSLGERIVLVAGVLLIIDLLFLPWHSIEIDLGGLANTLGVDTTTNRTGVQSPNAFYGIVALILALVMVVQIVLDRLTSVTLPDPPVPWAQVHVIAGITVAIMLVIKLIVETDFLAFGAFIGLLAALAVAYGGYTISQEHGRLPA